MMLTGTHGRLEWSITLQQNDDTNLSPDLKKDTGLQYTDITTNVS